MDNTSNVPIEIEGFEITQDDLFTLYDFLNHPGAGLHRMICDKLRRENINKTVGDISLADPTEFFRAQGFEHAFLMQEQMRVAVSDAVDAIRNNVS